MVKVKYKKIPESLQKMSQPVKDENNKRSSLGGTISVSEHYEIDIDRLIPFHNQARKNFDSGELEKLSNSIKNHGIRQPLTIIKSKIDVDKYEVVSGERRLRAAINAGFKKVPCIIISDYDLANEIAVVENIMRQDLHPIELASSFKSLMDSYGEKVTQTSVAEKIGVSVKVFSETLQYLNIPRDVQELLIQKNIKERDFLRKILKSKNPEKLIVEKENPKKNERGEISVSILRIVKKGGEFLFQTKGLKNLSKDEVAQLKTQLEKLF